MRPLATLLSALLMCGCVYTDKSGARCCVIVGLGIVRGGTTNEPAGTVLNVKALGLYAGGRTLNLGYISQTRIEVQTNANVMIELTK